MLKYRRLNFSIFIFIICTLYAPNAYAYLDPGTGSMLLSAGIALVAALFYFVKDVFYKIAVSISGLFGLKLKHKSKYGIVFYSEGGQYWNTFKPIIEALDKQGIELTFMTSDEADAGLLYQSDNVSSKFIGSGNKAYVVLNTLEADLCVMTTPCLDVLQIRRSKGVKHYAHIMHAAGGASYPLYSFDYYDSIFCTGEHQIAFIRELEELRGTTPKLLLKTGATFIDVLAEKLAAAPARAESSTKSILIAPSWGPNSLLQLFGAELIRPLLDGGYDVIVRPHPQSFVVENDVIEAIQNDLGDYDNLSWDTSPDGFEGLQRSDIMISDFSGIIFDYAFVFARPIITIKFEMDKTGIEAQDINTELWELDMLDKVGRQIDDSELPHLPEIISNILDDADNQIDFTDLREKHLFNFCSSGEVGAKQLLDIMEKLND